MRASFGGGSFAAIPSRRRETDDRQSPHARRIRGPSARRDAAQVPVPDVLRRDVRQEVPPPRAARRGPLRAGGSASPRRRRSTRRRRSRRRCRSSRRTSCRSSSARTSRRRRPSTSPRGACAGTGWRRPPSSARCATCFARAAGVPLGKALGGTREAIEVGVSLGISPTAPETVENVRKHVGAGLPADQAQDRARAATSSRLAAVREAFPDDHADRGRERGLHARRRGHAAVARRVRPRLHRAAAPPRGPRRPRGAREDAEDADLPRRVDPLGGRREGRDRSSAPARSSTSRSAASAATARPCASTTVAREAGVPVWCGGMLEAGVGRAHNVAIASLPGLLEARRHVLLLALLRGGHRGARARGRGRPHAGPGGSRARASRCGRTSSRAYTTVVTELRA